MSRAPSLSKAAKQRALDLAMRWRAQALLTVGSEHGFPTEDVRQEYLELAELMARKGGRSGNPDDGRVLRVADVMNATGMGQMEACRWVLAAIDAEGAEPTAAQIEAISEGRVEDLSAQVGKRLKSTSGPRSRVTATTWKASDPGA